MTLKIIVFAALSMSLTVSASEVGMSTYKFEAPKPKIQSILKARYVLDTAQELKASCPSDQKLIESTCDASGNTLHARYPTAPAFKPKLQVDAAGVATCKAGFVREDEVVTLSVALKCQEQASTLVE